MKKEIIIIFLVIMLAFTGTMSCSKNVELRKMRNQVEHLEEKLSESEKLSVNSATNIVDEKIVSNTELETNTYEVWETIAESPDATETQLILVARECYNGLHTLAVKVEKNNLTTGKVMEELSKSTDRNNWILVAESTKSNEQALLNIAEHCMDSNPKLAEKLINNSKTTSKVIEKLSTSVSYAVLLEVASSNKATEKALINVAEESAKGYPALAKAIVINPNMTLNVKKILQNSKDSRVSQIGASYK